MFCAYLNDIMAREPLQLAPILESSLNWLTEHVASATLGNYPLGKPDWFANVHTYETCSEAACIWESHAQTVDLQYVITGEEGIRWFPASKLNGPLRTFTDCDRLEWESPSHATSMLTLRSGMFAIFLPGEAHCPMIALDSPIHIRKAVVKIPIRLLLNQSS